MSDESPDVSMITWFERNWDQDVAADFCAVLITFVVTLGDSFLVSVQKLSTKCLVRVQESDDFANMQFDGGAVR